jgi:hypothetical protein
MTSISNVGRVGVDVDPGVVAVGINDASAAVVVVWAHTGRQAARSDTNRNNAIFCVTPSIAAVFKCGVNSDDFPFVLLFFLGCAACSGVPNTILPNLRYRNRLGNQLLQAGKTIALMPSLLKNTKAWLCALRSICIIRVSNSKLRKHRTQPLQWPFLLESLWR